MQNRYWPFGADRIILDSGKHVPVQGGIHLKIVEHQSFDEERALYGSRDILVQNCRFEGPADGESALKECDSIRVENCAFHLRYPLWHDRGAVIENCEMSETCRAALWYSENVEIHHSQLHGIKALRECRSVTLTDCDVLSPEFGWSTEDLQIESCRIQGEYFLLRAKNLTARKLQFTGKYSFQYVENAVIENSVLDTKDAFWHAKNVVVRNSVVRGEYLAWYCSNVTFEHCRIEGTQPFCYCENLKLIDCEMINTDLCFERSDVHAEITTPVVSIKNPWSGQIFVPEVGEIIRDDPRARGEIIIGTASPSHKPLSPAG